MKASEIRGLTDEEMAQRLRETRQEMFNLRMQKSLGQAERPLRMRAIRRDAARILTIAGERQRRAEKTS